VHTRTLRDSWQNSVAIP